MSARKMVADSTQELTKKRKKEEAKKKRNVKKRKSEEPEDPELMDLTVDLKPISGYIRNPEEMVEHMFKSLRGTTLTGMLPDILRVVPVDELKELCLNELEVMSKKRVKRIIAGEDPDEISSSDSDDELESESEDEEEEEEETQEEAEEEQEEGAISISEEEEEDEEVASLEDVSDDEEVVSNDNRYDDEEEGAINMESLDDVSSVESPSDFRHRRESDDESEEDDGLEIKPRAYGEDVEDGEVMSSGDEDCDPMWRTRGEEEVERCRKESEWKNDDDEEVLLHAESPKRNTSSPLPSTSKESAPASPIPSTSKETSKPSKNQKKILKKSSSMDDIEMEEVRIGEEESSEEEGEEEDERQVEFDTEKDEKIVEVVEKTISKSPEGNEEASKTQDESRHLEQDEIMEVVDKADQEQPSKKDTGQFDALETNDVFPSEQKVEGKDIPAASVVEEVVLEELGVPMEKSKAYEQEVRKSEDEAHRDKVDSNNPTETVTDVAAPTETNSQKVDNEISTENSPDEVVITYSNSSGFIEKIDDTVFDVREDTGKKEVAIRDFESVTKDDIVIEGVKPDPDPLENIPVDIKSETAEEMDTNLCETLEHVSEVVKEESCEMDHETTQPDAEYSADIVEGDSEVKQSYAENLVDIPFMESDAKLSEVEKVETVLESTRGTMEVETAEKAAVIRKSEPKTVLESPRKDDIIESVGSPASADDIFATINRISEELIDDVIPEKRKEAPGKKGDEIEEEESKEMEETEPPYEEQDSESPFKSKRRIKVSRPHLRSHNKDPPSPVSEHSDTNAVETSKTSTSCEPKKVMFDDSKNKVIRLTDSKKQKVKTKAKVDNESQPKRGSILSSKSKKSDSKPSTSSGRTSQSSSSDVITKEDDVLAVAQDDVDNLESTKESVELAEGSSELLELEMRARAIRAMLKAQDP